MTLTGRMLPFLVMVVFKIVIPIKSISFYCVISSWLSETLFLTLHAHVAAFCVFYKFNSLFFFLSSTCYISFLILLGTDRHSGPRIVSGERTGAGRVLSLTLFHKLNAGILDPTKKIQTLYVFTLITFASIYMFIKPISYSWSGIYNMHIQLTPSFLRVTIPEMIIIH